MGDNSPVDKLIVQKVFEMSAAGNSHGEIGVFFHHTRRWAQHKVLKQNGAKQYLKGRNVNKPSCITVRNQATLRSACP